MKERPRELTEEEVREAGAGRSEEVLGKRRPLPLTEEEVKAASQGKSQQILERKEKKR